MFPTIIDIPTFSRSDGDLSVIDKSNILPFELKRIFYIYNLPIGAKRGEHAHISQKQFIWCLKGEIEVFTISMKQEECRFRLNKANIGLYLPEKTWSYQVVLAEDSIYSVAASDFYDDSDYIREMSEFMSLISSE